MVLETKRLILRTWKKEDINELHELAKAPQVGPPCGWEPHKSLRESKAVLRDILMNDYTYAIVSKQTGQIIGNISLMPYSESRFARNENQAEIGFWLGHPYWGQGYMTEACMQIIKYGFEVLHLEKIWCAHDLQNYNSMRVQEKSGFAFHHEETISEKEKKILLKVNCIDNKISLN